MSYKKKAALINFICDYQEDTSLEKSIITHLVDYALKEISSFGGFVVTEEKQEEILGIMVVNNTGIEGYMPNNLIVLGTFLPNIGKEGSKKRILQKNMHITRGEAALLIKKSYQPKNFLHSYRCKNNKNDGLMVSDIFIDYLN